MERQSGRGGGDAGVGGTSYERRGMGRRPHGWMRSPSPHWAEPRQTSRRDQGEQGDGDECCNSRGAVPVRLACLTGYGKPRPVKRGERGWCDDATTPAPSAERRRSKGEEEEEEEEQQLRASLVRRSGCWIGPAWVLEASQNGCPPLYLAPPPPFLPRRHHRSTFVS